MLLKVAKGICACTFQDFIENNLGYHIYMLDSKSPPLCNYESGHWIERVVYLAHSV